jgi:hypothetical protein
MVQRGQVGAAADERRVSREWVARKGHDAESQHARWPDHGLGDLRWHNLSNDRGDNGDCDLVAL